MAYTDFQEDPWGRRWCHAPRYDDCLRPAKRKPLHKIPRSARGPATGGIACMLIAAFLFAAGASMARFASAEVNTFALVFWTNSFCFAIMCVWCAVLPPRD